VRDSRLSDGGLMNFTRTHVSPRTLTRVGYRGFAVARRFNEHVFFVINAIPARFNRFFPSNIDDGKREESDTRDLILIDALNCTIYISDLLSFLTFDRA